MEYKVVSSKQVISRVLRRTRLSDTSYLEDMKVWLPEAINSLRTTHSLELVTRLITSHNHISLLPSDLSSVEAVMYKGKRLRLASSVLPLNMVKTLSDATLTAYITNPNHKDILGTEKGRGEHLEMSTVECTNHTYKVQTGCIHTSFSDGDFILIYRRLPVDCDGFIMIPDNNNYKQAIEWYIYQQMTFSGYILPDKKMDYSFCTSEFERFASRALKEITYPSVDKMESLYRSTTNLIFPQHYWEHFGTGLEQIQEIKGL